MRFRAAVGLMVFMAGLTAESADARFRVCNKSDTVLSVAFGRIDRARGWVAKGWWVIDTGRCANVYPDDLDNRYFYAYAEAKGGGPAWKGGTVPFCVEDSEFLLFQEQYGKNTPEDCAKAGLRSARFISIDVGQGERNHTLNFSGPLSPSSSAAPPSPQPPIAEGPPPSQPSPVAPPPTGSEGGAACQRYPNLC